MDRALIFIEDGQLEMSGTPEVNYLQPMRIIRNFTELIVALVLFEE